MKTNLDSLYKITLKYQEENSLGAHPFEYYYLLPEYIKKYN